MNTPLEVMKAIVDNGGPILCYVGDFEKGDAFAPLKIVGVAIGHMEPFIGERSTWKFASLTDPCEKDEREVCPNCGEKAWRIALDKGMPGCANCKKPWHVPITDPNKTYAPLAPWVNDWAKWRAVDDDGTLYEYTHEPTLIIAVWDDKNVGLLEEISKGHDPTNWENSLEERKRTTRPMTAREFARFVGENMGQYLYQTKGWDKSDWVMHPHVTDEEDPFNWLYAHNTEVELEWMELPQVEE